MVKPRLKRSLSVVLKDLGWSGVAEFKQRAEGKGQRSFPVLLFWAIWLPQMIENQNCVAAEVPRSTEQLQIDRNFIRKGNAWTIKGPTMPIKPF